MFLVAETDTMFLSEAVKFLKIVNDEHGILPHTTIMRIQDIIKELEDILEENE